jgi:hypothetical protein
LYQELHG